MVRAVDDHQSRVGQNPTGAALTTLLILYVGGEGGTGKRRIVNTIVAGMNMIGRKDEVIHMAPTGTAADNISGNPYHTSLGISIHRARRTTMKARIAKSLNRSSHDHFGGLPVIIFISDFFQFPPVRGPALWKEPRRGSGENEHGLLIWHHFKHVIILDEQMRQSEYAPFRDLLSRARTGTLTEADRSIINSKTITSLVSPHLDDATTVVKLNPLRHQVNRVRIDQFARTRCQEVYIFPALHTRTRLLALPTCDFVQTTCSINRTKGF
ncbi:unnamed protein product [Penicillium camemberti]|uniref:Str. FM013 n=1 Tax=Penicillium camemberti (strain FM 013) TaxID=1429867 RepID=A0A0G4PHZ4_PENC3|nr:unnamed protein product [Penicillium camemberti]